MEATARLLGATANPFGVEIWDCAPFTRSTLSVSRSQEIARSFVALRKSDGAEYRTEPPPDKLAHACDLRYKSDRSTVDGPLFKAAAMEDKWDVYLYRPHLYFARSWTGTLIYRVTVDLPPDLIVVSAIEGSVEEDPHFSLRVVDYLIRSHLLGMRIPHPLPADLPPEPRAIALFSLSYFGRRCFWGYYGDTTQIQPLTAP